MLILDFFGAVKTFYSWGFPLDVMTASSILAGLVVGLLLRRGSLGRKIFPVACICVTLMAEILWQLFHSEYLILLYALGWVTEAGLLSWAAGTMARAVFEKLRKIF